MKLNTLVMNVEHLNSARHVATAHSAPATSWYY